MADGSYDNSNSGVFFKPYDDQHLFGQGKLNIEGVENRIVVVRERLTRDGDLIPVVYQRLGPLFPNDKKGNDKAPDRSGPMDTHPDHRMAVWAGEKDGRKYFSMKVSRKQQESGGSSGAASGATDDGWGAGGGMADDEIPF
jgi:hypothetical protein